MNNSSHSMVLLTLVIHFTLELPESSEDKQIMKIGLNVFHKEV